MKLNKFTWNNGTQSSPIILTNDQIKKLIAIGQKTDIVNDIRGYVTTNSRKMQKFLKYALTQQFPNLNIICDEELADIFTLQTSSDIIKEGTKEFITISTDTGITHNFLKWKYEYSDFTIDGDISQDIIKNRIRIENGFLVVDEPKENASWSVTLKLTAYPIYYNDSDFDTIPITSKPDITLTITAKKITDITVSTEEDVPINSKVDVKVTPIPSDSTKLKGATYTYTTTTPDIVAINNSSFGTEIITKKQGIGNITVTIHACNNIVTKSNSTTFNVYDLRPICFIIDQRGLNGLSDPDFMVSDHYVRNSDGSLKWVSKNGVDGSPNNNTIAWIRKNTHAFVSRNMGLNGIRLKQLDDTTRKKFADGTSAVDYISNESGNYDVFIKFGSDIYYKTEAYTPEGESSPDPDYVLVTIARELPDGEDDTKWEKWSQYKLIGVYKACNINNKLHSLSGKRPANNITQEQSIVMAKNNGKNFDIVDYDMTKLFAFLFYGYYSSLASQQICGYGTSNVINGICYPKITGNTDDLAMTDTTTITGNGAEQPDEDQIKAGIGSDIKSINFWGLENCWGDLYEHMSNSKAINKNTISKYLTNGNSVLIYKLDGTCKVYTSNDMFLEDFSNSKQFFCITDKNDNIIRAINIDGVINTYFTNKMMFGPHADIIAKQKDGSANTYFCDRFRGYHQETNSFRSCNSNDSEGGVSYLSIFTAIDPSTKGTRLIYNGNENNIYIINDETESL